MQTFWLYMLRCGDGSLYLGHTDNLETRIAAHRHGLGCEYTRQRLPVRLVWTQEFPSRDEAFTRERQLKNWSRAKKEALIVGDWSRIKRLACGHG